MTKLTAQSRKAKKALVTPSSRDSIANWLDVLTSMLSLPEPKRMQVRDELEDHLRSRVDDLLITGTAEPEAIRIAVAELGETAELAKLISHAHTRANPRRRMMNAIILVTAMAGMTFGGYSLISVPSTVELDPSTQAVVAVSESNERANETRMLDIVNKPTLMAFDEIADMWGYVIDVHSLKPSIVSNLQHRNVTVAGEMTLIRAIQTLKMQSLQHASELTTEINGDVIELLTHDEATRRTVITRVSLVPSWITNSDQRQSYAKSIEQILKVKHDLRFTSIQNVGSSIVVAAPPEIQHEIEIIVQELRSVAEKNFAERKIRSEESEAKRAAERKVSRADQQARSQEIAEQKRAGHLEAVIRIQTEFDKVSESLWATKEKINLVTTEVLVDNVFNPNRHSKDEYQAYMQGLSIKLEKLQYELADIEERYTYLRTRLLESEYAQLFEGLE